MGSEKDKMGGIRTRWEVTKTRREITRTSLFPRGRSHRREQDLGRVSEVSNMFDILPIHGDKPGNHRRS